MDVQELDRDPDLRVKFASIDANGAIIGDALDEYGCLFTSLPEGWTAFPAGTIVTRSEGIRTAWRLARDGTELGAVEHETGVEFLLAIAGNAAGGVASAAIVGFATWAWRRWHELRASKPLAPSLVLERVVERSVTGQPLVTARRELRGPLGAAAVGRSIGEILERQPDARAAATAYRGIKLAAVALGLAAIEAVTLYLLLANAGASAQAITMFGIATPLHPPWTMAVLGGVLGGTTRALYAFLVEVAAFQIRSYTGHPSVYRAVPAHGQPVNDDFDWMQVWYLYLVKPLVGAGMGLLFALLIELGLVPFAGDGSRAENWVAWVLVAGLAGLFAENVLDALRGLLRR